MYFRAEWLGNINKFVVRNQCASQNILEEAKEGTGIKFDGGFGRTLLVLLERTASEGEGAVVGK